MIPDYVVGRKVYIASSWRNKQHDTVVNAVLNAGHLVYNYREDAEDLHTAWSVYSGYRMGSTDVYQLSDMLAVREAHNKFIHHRAALDWCDTCVLLLPSGNDAHLELGYAAGMSKHTVILSNEAVKPGLMYKFAIHIVSSIETLLGVLAVPLPQGCGI